MILLTGCAGFIGSNLVNRLLDNGHQVIGIDCFRDYYDTKIKQSNLASALKYENFTLVSDDILGMDSFPNVDVIFHMAAQPGVRNSWGRSFNIYVKDNVEATQKLLEYYKDKKIKNFVYSSSSSVYGDAALPMNEESRPKPVSPYGVTKLAGENLCYLYHKNYGIPAISLRYFTVYGPRQRPDMAIYKFTDSIYHNKEILIYGDGTQTRDFTFIDDIVEANLLAAQSDSSGNVFNIGGGSRVSVNEVIILIEEQLDKKAIVKYVDHQKGDVQDTLADTSRAREILKWKPQYSINEGIKRYVKWYKDTMNKFY